MVWNPRGFLSIKVIGDGDKFNGAYHRAETLSPLSDWRSIEANGNE
jgi:hypothetical protein